MEKIKKYHLNLKKTLSYFVDQIECEKTLSQKILKKIDFHNGEFFTVLPSTALLDKLYEFPYGGIIPSLPYDNQGNRYVKTMDEELSLFIKSFTKKNDLNCAIIEAYMMSYDEDYLNLKNVSVVPYNKEVYYLMHDKNSEGEIYRIIRSCSEVWHFLCILTKMENNKDLKSIKLKMEDAIKNLKFIITNAYDGEGYIFWEKNHSKGKLT